MSGNISSCNLSSNEENESRDLNPEQENCQRVLTSLRKANPDRLIFAQLNINSIRNKFDYLSDLVKGKVDVLLISETKIDDSYPKSQVTLRIEGFMRLIFITIYVFFDDTLM